MPNIDWLNISVRVWTCMCVCACALSASASQTTLIHECVRKSVAERECNFLLFVAVWSHLLIEYAYSAQFLIFKRECVGCANTH